MSVESLNAQADPVRLFYQGLDHFGDAIAVIEASNGKTLSYRELAAEVSRRGGVFGAGRKLVFMEAKNDVRTLIDYLACLDGGHVVHLVEALDVPKTQELVSHYRPNLLIDAKGEIALQNSVPHPLHPACALLLSTSGSTGSPKFVKLSARNLNSNAIAIADYLKLSTNDRALQHLKPFYSYGLSVINSHLCVGASLVLSDNTVLEDAFWQAFDSYSATSFAGVPYTFETLRRSGFDVSCHKSLRYATQAGGKLEANLVKEFATAFAASGREFYVMYGQTEAAPRISYLPPHEAESHPGSIGRAIPGGRLFIRDEQGGDITDSGQAGELVYEGPNIMMGYATCPEELSSDETPSFLLTGDVARLSANGLFEIVGRSSRFIKPFGVRVNLDEVQTYVKSLNDKVALVTGDDKLILIAFEGALTGPDINLEKLADRFGLTTSIFRLRAFEKLPQLANGKFDLHRILREGHAEMAPPATAWGRFLSGIKALLGIEAEKYECVAEVFAAAISGQSLSPSVTFRDLSVDSLAFVGISIEMEALFGGELPKGWQEMPLKSLEEIYESQKALRN